MKNIKRVLHFGQQQTEEWQKLRLGKFTSSTIYNLFNEPTKKEKAIEVVKRMKEGKFDASSYLDDNFDYSVVNNDYLNYVYNYLNPGVSKTNEECKEAKKEVKNFLNSKALLGEKGKELLTAIIGIEKIELLASSSLKYIKTKALDLFYNESEINFGGAACEHGNEFEPVASSVFKQRNYFYPDTPKIAFCELQGLETGTSPDDTENKTTPSEYKCPYNRNVHMEHTKIKNDTDLLNYDKQKYYQIHHQIFCLGAENGFWSSFDPRLIENPKTTKKALHTIEIRRNEELCKEFERRISMALKIRNKYLEEFYKS